MSDAPLALTVGLVVEHLRFPLWGRGVVVAASGSFATIRWSGVGADGRPRGEAQFDTRQALLRKSGDQSPVQTMVARRSPHQPARTHGPPSSQTWETLLQRFRGVFPGQFGDRAYIQREREWKVRAGEVARIALTHDMGLWPRGEQFADLVQRVIRAMGKRPPLHSTEVMAFIGALRSPNAADQPRIEAFRASLHAVLAAEQVNEASMSAYLHATTELPRTGKSDPGKWTIATLLPFLCDPTRHMLLKPSYTHVASAALGVHLNYSTRLSWLTYQRLLGLSAGMLERLREYGASDYIDVQSFIYVTCGGYTNL